MRSWEVESDVPLQAPLSVIGVFCREYCANRVVEYIATKNSSPELVSCLFEDNLAQSSYLSFYGGGGDVYSRHPRKSDELSFLSKNTARYGGRNTKFFGGVKT